MSEEKNSKISFTTATGKHCVLKTLLLGRKRHLMDSNNHRDVLPFISPWHFKPNT